MLLFTLYLMGSIYNNLIYFEITLSFQEELKLYSGGSITYLLSFIGIEDYFRT